MSKAQEERCEAAEDRLAGQGERTDHTDRPEGSASTEEQKRPSSGGGDLTIYLFGRTGREKEEWFRRFLLASRVKLEGRGGGLAGVGKSGEIQITIIDGLVENMWKDEKILGWTVEGFSHSSTHICTHPSPQSE